jgi:hypothetical protein
VSGLMTIKTDDATPAAEAIRGTPSALPLVIVDDGCFVVSWLLDLKWFIAIFIPVHFLFLFHYFCII